MGVRLFPTKVEQINVRRCKNLPRLSLSFQKLILSILPVLGTCLLVGQARAGPDHLKCETPACDKPAWEERRRESDHRYLFDKSVNVSQLAE
jgi:hypothetical protein